MVFVDNDVHLSHGARIDRYFRDRGIDHEIRVVDVSEETKTIDTVFDVVSSIEQFGLNRRGDPIIAIGGGVLTDVVGLAASLYRRSTPYVRVPTTLIGMVDASIGAKTGVNFEQCKNRLGSYFPSVVTLVDPAFLATLSARQIRNGLAEILKMALVKDGALFELLAEHGARLVAEKLQSDGSEDRGEVATRVITRAIEGMLQELQPNLWEDDLRRVVDYGHSFSPAIEMAALPDLLHGEAVAIDMALSVLLSHGRGLLDGDGVARILEVFDELDLPCWHPVCTQELLAGALADTIRHRDGEQLIPLTVAIGSAVFVNDVSPGELSAARSALVELSSRHGARAVVEGG